MSHQAGFLRSACINGAEAAGLSLADTAAWPFQAA